jgi:signal transduction histidine kinase
LFWSLGANLALFLTVSSWRGPNAEEAAQARVFVDALRHQRPPSLALWRGSAEVAELIALAERFLGTARAGREFTAFAIRRGMSTPGDLPADAETVHFAETLLAGAIGSASARVMVASVAKEEVLGLDEVLHILDEASQIRAYSRDLELKSRQLEEATAELKAANLRLQELDRLKDDFMSSVTHELRTPLASIRAFSEILYDDPEIDLKERKRFLGILVSETERLSRLVNQVLDLAKIESGHADWQTGQVDLNEVVEQAVAATEQLLRHKGTEIRLHLPDRQATVWADRDRLVQVVVNLLSNAAKFAPEGSGRVEVSLQQQAGSNWKVRVTDNGPGIPDEDLPFVFEKFRQGGGGTGKPVGTGLGLPISRQIIEHFGGRIWAESQPGKGATLVFMLPVSGADSRVLTAETSS